MDGHTLSRFALSDCKIRPTFGGVFARDMLPQTIGHYRSYIINTHPMEKPGEHWQSVYFDSKDKCYFFCSYGMPPSPEIRAFANRNSSTLQHNPHLFQAAHTSTCGLFSLYFLYHMSRGLPITGLKPNRTFDNEKVIQRFARHQLNLSCTGCCSNAQQCQPYYKYNEQHTSHRRQKK